MSPGIIRRSQGEYLKGLQDEFAEGGKTVQIVVTSHSPSVLTRCGIEELIILRGRQGVERVSQCAEADLREIAAVMSGGGEKGYSKKLRRVKRQAELLFLLRGDVLFAECVVVAEGETEEGALAAFGERMVPRFDADEVGVSIVDGRGKDAEYTLWLLQQLKIPFVWAYDRADDWSRELAEEVGGIVTEKKAFEDEVCSTIPLDLLIRVLGEINERRTEAIVRDLANVSGFEGIGSVEELTELVGEMEPSNYPEELISCVRKGLIAEKGYMTGRLVAQSVVGSEQIPAIYKRVLSEAREKAVGLG